MSDAILSSQKALAEEEEGGSAVSWAAVLAGAFVASAFSIALVALGAGLGLVSVLTVVQQQCIGDHFRNPRGGLAYCRSVVCLGTRGIFCRSACAHDGSAYTRTRSISATRRMDFLFGGWARSLARFF